VSSILKLPDFSLTLSVFPDFPWLPQNSLTFPDHRNPVKHCQCHNHQFVIIINVIIVTVIIVIVIVNLTIIIIIIIIIIMNIIINKIIIRMSPLLLKRKSWIKLLGRWWRRRCSRSRLRRWFAVVLQLRNWNTFVCYMCILHRVSKKTSTHVIGYKLRNSCPIFIIFDTKIPHIIWHRMTA